MKVVCSNRSRIWTYKILPIYLPMGILGLIFSKRNELLLTAYRFHQFDLIHSKHLQDSVMTSRQCKDDRREKSQKESEIWKNSVPCSPPHRLAPFKQATLV